MTKAEFFEDFLTSISEKCCDRDIRLKWAVVDDEPRLFVEGRYGDLKDMFCAWIRYYLMRVLEDDN